MKFHQDMTWPELTQPHIWVFGSNLQGMHGRGAALIAAAHFDAERGVGKGRTGNAYAIPTKATPRKSLTLPEIQPHVDEFLNYARKHQELKFWVTRVGCILAGYSDDQIAPMFRYAPDNCNFARDWKVYLL